MLRQPIIVVMGHVDHGKTALLDKIRNTRVHQREKGAITQHIGASEVPTQVLKEIGGKLLERFKFDIKIPGLLFIDTPGHEAFTNLRKRGGSIADFAILVVDATQGFQPQTIESINILREYKTPFIIALNKIDLIPGWRPAKTYSFLESLANQKEEVIQDLENRVYDTVGKIAEHGFNADRFDRVKDFTKEVGIVPVSAKTGEGIAELMILIAGLSQKYLEVSLRLNVSGPGRGSILEVKEERGLGTTLDVILYDGTLKVGDRIAFSSMEGPKTTKVRALLKPKPLDEMRDPRDKFSSVKEVHAAAGVKIAAPDLEGALPGSELVVVDENEKEILRNLQKDVEDILTFTEGEGVIVKADTLGSLEAMIRLLRDAGIRIGKVGIGNVSRKDIIDATAVRDHNPYLGVVLAFNVKLPRDVEAEAKTAKIPVFVDQVVYLLIEKYTKWVEEKREADKRDAFSKLAPIGKVRVLPACCFRVSKPAIFGVAVEVGRIKPNTGLMNQRGEIVGTIKNIQHNKESLPEATKGMEVAISVDGCVFGRSVHANDVLYTYVPKSDAQQYLEKYNNLINDEEMSLLMEIMRLSHKR